jgi:hypothetical protein
LDISRLHLTTYSASLQDGLLEQVHFFISTNPGTRLIVIDTLEHIRRNSAQDKSLYAIDYRDMNLLREVTNIHKLTLLVIHHTRKMYDPDPLNTLSGSTGLAGASDGVFILEKIKRTGQEAKLTIANRDTKGYCFNLRFDDEKCRWIFVGNHISDDEAGNNLYQLLDDFLCDEWSGTATDLCNGLKKLDCNFKSTPAVLRKELNSSKDFFKNELHIDIDFDRTHSKKLITIKRITQDD